MAVPMGAHVTNVGNSSGYLRGLLLSRWPLSFDGCARAAFSERKIEQRARGLYPEFEMGWVESRDCQSRPMHGNEAVPGTEWRLHRPRSGSVAAPHDEAMTPEVLALAQIVVNGISRMSSMRPPRPPPPRPPKPPPPPLPP